MAILRTKQIRETAPKDLDSRLGEMRLELMKEYGNVKMGKPIKNTGRIRELKKSIARILTVKNEMRTKQDETRIKQNEGKKK